MTGDEALHRRVGDPVLNELTTKVALLEQGARLGAEADKARATSIESQFGTVNTKLDRILDGQNDPDATAGGRALRTEIKDVRDDVIKMVPQVAGHEELRQQLIGALRMARLAIAVAGLSAGGQFLGLIADIIKASHS